MCLGLLLSTPSVASQTLHPEGKSRGTVIVLHGIARTSASMGDVARYLQQAGYLVHNLDYASTDLSVHVIADAVYADVKALVSDNEPLYFVTYSMGGIVLRAIMAEYSFPSVQRVVMIAPPNQGSEVADFVQDNTLYQWIYGPAGQQLGVAKGKAIHKKLPPSLDVELGIIAGDRSVDPISSAIIPGKDDGKVAIDRTRIKGMKDHITVHASHLFIIKNKEAMRQAVYFLEHGGFDHGK